MPVINVVCSDEDHKRLQDEYKQMTVMWPLLGNKSSPPTFEEWLGKRISLADKKAIPAAVDDIRVFNAVEKLITSLDQHGFCLAHLAGQQTSSEESALALASVIVVDLKLQPQYLVRIQNLFEHYLKSAKDIAEHAQVNVTTHAYDTLNDAYQKLAERSIKATHLDGERTTGRIEGALAMLVSLDIMDRKTAQEKTEEFKAQLSIAQKSSWVGKVFGGTGKKE